MAYAGKTGERQSDRQERLAMSNAGRQPRLRRMSRSWVAGLAIGIVIGAGLALLLAPEAGADTRRRLRRGARRAGRRGRDAWEDLTHELRRARRRLASMRRRTRDGVADEAEAVIP